MATAEILNLVNTALLVLLVYRLLVKRMTRHYPIVLTYFLFSAVNSLVANVIIFAIGITSDIYNTHYYGYSIFMPVFQVWILLDLLRRALSFGFNRPRISVFVVLFSLLLGTPLFIGVIFVPVSAFHRFQAITLVFQMMLVLLIYVYLLERRDIELGRNFKAILGGMALLTSCQGLNFLSFFQNRIPFSFFQIAVPGIYAFAVTVFLIGLWDYQPFSFKSERRALNLGLQKGLRLLINLSQPK